MLQYMHKINNKLMSKMTTNQPFRKKFAYDLYNDALGEKPNPYQTPSKHSTIQFKHTDNEITYANFSIQSSRIAEETEPVITTPHYQDIIRQKVDHFQAETYKIIQKKESDIYFLTVELQNYEVRLNEAELMTQRQKDEILQLRSDIQQLITQNNQITQNNTYLQQTLLKMGTENSRLKQSLEVLIAQKNESLKMASKKEYMSVQSNHNANLLKREVEDLRIMIADMEHSIKNCTSCFSLRRENQELAEAYNNIKRLYSELGQEKSQHQKHLLQNITAKIQENQNILRENIQLREKRSGSGLRAGRQRLKESVAKRCRTLTDQF